MSINSPFNSTTYPAKNSLVGGDVFCLGDSAVLVGGVPSNSTITFTNFLTNITSLGTLTALNLGSSAVAAWNADTGIARSAAGVLEWNNGTKGVPATSGGLTIPNPAVAATSTAGVTTTFTASSATAGNITNGAAAGGGFTLNMGAAARLVSGNAAGGNFRVVPGAGIGTGAAGALIVQQPGGTPGTNEVQIYNDGTNSYVVSPSQTLVICKGGNNFTAGLDGSNNNCFAFQTTSSGGILGAYHSNSQSVAIDGINQRLGLSSVATIVWSVNNNQWGNSPDTGLARAVAGVVQPTTGGATGGWLQNTAGEAALNAAFTDATGTLAVTNLSRTLIAGRSYRIHGVLRVSNSLAADGVKIDFNGGTATITAGDFFIGAAAIGLGTTVAVATVSTTLAGVINYSTITGTEFIVLDGFIRCLAGGTFIMRAATNTTVSGTLTLGIGSNLGLNDTVML